ncbi:MAG: transketolase [Puniceicoccales bacterium]|jgi:transketolase|nr:transketolase [Puniceicoccales bacterium]
MDCEGICGDCTARAVSCDGGSPPLGEEERIVLADSARAARALVLDMLAAAGSGHMGMSLGCAEIGALLFGKFLRCDGTDTGWLDRDRFVLSAGHGSAFLYGWLHLAGFPVGLDDLRSFRRGSVASGHPEFSRPLGVECTSGPLGQGVANSVGMALSQQLLAAHLGDEVSLLEGRTVCLAGDGCLQEGVALEALSLAGLWELGNLIFIYDDNGIMLDGPAADSQRPSAAAVLQSLGWHVQSVDGHDLDQLHGALYRARAFPDGKPQAIIARTVAGQGVPSIAGSHRTHGLPLSGEELRAARKELLPDGEPFVVPQNVREFFIDLAAERRRTRIRWQERFSFLLERQPDLLELLCNKSFSGDFLEKNFPPFGSTPLATRKSGSAILQEVARNLPTFVSLSADLFTSTGTAVGGSPTFSAYCTAARNIQCGTREHAMGAIASGLAYDGIFRPVASTFLVFSDYLRPAIRVSAMAHLPVLYIFTHDSIAVGEDGPTHQPVETLPALRSIPNLDVVRPADGEECVGAFALAVDSTQRPTALIFSRQNLPDLGHLSVGARRAGVRRGGYVLRPERQPLRSLLLASGGEVQLALAAAEPFPHCRVVSMPCLEAFARQPADYREEILPSSCRRRLAVEAAGPESWLRYVDFDHVVAVHDFGESRNGAELLIDRGFSVEALRERLALLEAE